MKKLDQGILSEMFRALQLLGADEYFLQLVGNVGNGPDCSAPQITHGMRMWNEEKLQEFRNRIRSYEIGKAISEKGEL